MKSSSPFDVVLVDGRFRTACALQAWFVSANSTVVIIHDWTDRRQYYIVLDYFDVVEQVDSMIVLRADPVKQADPKWIKRAQRDIAKHEHNPF